MTYKRIEVPFYPQAWNFDQWQNMGFKNREEAEYWEPRSCGVLSLKMAAEALDSSMTPLPIAEYIRKGLSLNAYIEPIGWKHAGLVALAKSFGFHAEQLRAVSPNALKEIIDTNSLPIVSIKWAFVNNKRLKEKLLFWKKYGGHLAVVVGCETDNNKLVGFYVHHTSIRSEYNWQSRLVPLTMFKQGFTGRCIVLGKEKN